MKKLLPIIILVAVIAIFFRSFFLHGFLPIPSDTLVGLYNPFRDVVAKEFPRGVPFKNFLITDPIRQQYPWRQLSISQIKHLQLPLWNPYSFSGYPLLANFQSGALYPLNIIFLFLPFSLSWTILIIIQPLLAGIFLYLYLRNIKIHPLASLLGAIAFAFSGFSISWLEWGVIMQTFLWLPFLLLCIDKIYVYKENRRIWYPLYFFGLASSLLAGHLQIFFYVFIVVHIYLLVRWYQMGKPKKEIIWGISFAIITLLITSLQWLPTLQFILLSARNFDQSFLQPGWFIPWQHLVQFIFPDFFGNPTTLNYWGVWNYGELVGYIGILPLMMAVLAIVFRHDKKTYFWTIVTIVSLLFALPTPFAQIPYIIHIPFLSTSQPTRLMGVIDVSLAVLAAFGLDMVLKKNKAQGIFVIVGIFSILLLGVWIFVARFASGIAPMDLAIAKHNMVFPTAIFISIGLVFLLYAFFYKKLPAKARMLIICCLVFIAILDLLRFAEKFTPFTSQQYLYPPAKTISYLQENIGIYRFMTTDSQILPPNVSDIYKLQSIEGYDPLYIERYGAFVASIQRNKPDISTPFGFNRIVTPHNYMSPLISLLGVKYILTFDDLTQKQYKKVLQEGKTNVYENKDVLPRAFFISQSVNASNKQEAINKVFDNKNNLNNVAVVEGNIQSRVFIKGSVHTIHYSANKIALQTNDSGIGFLVLSDIYYPTWHATIDGKVTAIYITDFTFRGVIVPAGKHTVVFEDKLF